MVVATAQQLRQTYHLWRRFSMPIEGGVRDAISVPSNVGNQLNSAYTIMVTSMIVNLWCILFAGAVFLMLNRNTFNTLSTSLWNKRSSMADSFFELTGYAKTQWKVWWIYPAIAVVLACWAAQTALSVIVPPYIFVGNAAPVNSKAIFAPPNNDISGSAQAQVFALDVPAALRAAGSAQVAKSDIRARVSVGTTDLESFQPGKAMKRIDYKYNVSGADLGLQRSPTLLLTVTGQCTTEYGWLLNTTQEVGTGIYSDTYSMFGNDSETITLSVDDAPSPMAFFHVGPTPPGPPGNQTWAAYVSSVDRYSYSIGTDPLYLTGHPDDDALANLVLPQRPVLSCWQMDVWSYNGRNSTIARLDSTSLPGLKLPLPLQLILSRYLGIPRVVSIGTQLGLSALVSSASALGIFFDAGSSSVYNDLERLVLAAYIATTNTLTDTTLSLQRADTSSSAANIALGDDGQPAPGVGDFVVWSTDISTLSIKAIIIIPVLSVLMWLVVLAGLQCTPLRMINALDAVKIHEAIAKKFPDARPSKDGWYFGRTKKHDEEDPEPMLNSQAKGVTTTVTEKGLH